MNISDLTDEQRLEVLHHLRAAALARALQWDHELKIESILGREINIEMQDLACGIDGIAAEMTPDDITIIGINDLTDWIPDKPA